MQDITTTALPAIGAPLAGGFFAGQIRIAGQNFALIVAPKAEGEHAPAQWGEYGKDVPGAKSYFDGLANTNAMAEAGSELAQWARGLRLGGFEDWYLPSQDELEIIYRNLKPTTEENHVYNRSGMNLSAVEPTRPYTLEAPAQTEALAFREGGAEAFDDNWYWSSTQHASDSDCAWFQDFDYGDQHCNSTNRKLRARAVRRLPL